MSEDQPIKLRPGARIRIRTAELPPNQRHKGQDVFVELVLGPVVMTYLEANERMRKSPKGHTCEVKVSEDGVTTFHETIPIPCIMAASWRVHSRAGYATVMLEATGVELDVEGIIPEEAEPIITEQVETIAVLRKKIDELRMEIRDLQRALNAHAAADEFAMEVNKLHANANEHQLRFVDHSIGNDESPVEAVRRWRAQAQRDDESDESYVERAKAWRRPVDPAP